MKRIIHHIICVAICTIIGTTFMACEIKRDTNGELGGMWQLTLWTDAQGDTVATNKNAIYYHFQQKLMKLERMDGKGTGQYLLYFTHEPNNLIISNAYARPYDTPVELSTLQHYGIPQDGHFHIDALNDSRMQLSSVEGTMSFRKY